MKYFLIIIPLLIMGCSSSKPNLLLPKSCSIQAQTGQCKNTYELNPNINLVQQLDNSLLKWQKLNQKNYEYSVNFASWTGFGHNTTITISNNNAIKREYQFWDRDGKNISQWVEKNISTLNSHKEGAEPLNMEQLYTNCRSILIDKNTNDFQLYLSFDKKGILKQCQSSPKNCVDDCSTGINIQSLTFFNNQS